MAQSLSDNQAQIRQPERSWGLTLDGLWLLVMLTLIYIFTALSPQIPNDFWWHIAVGRVIAESGQVPTTNIWAYTVPADAPYYYQSWLGSWVMYQLWRLGDVPLLMFVRNLVVLLSYVLLAWHLRRRCGSGRVSAAVLLLVALLGAGFWYLRPQTLVLPLFVLLVVVLNEYRDGWLGPRWLLIFPLVMALWVNLHGSFMAGLALIGIVAIGEALSLLVGEHQALRFGRWRWLALTGLAMLAATLLNPRGAGVYTYLQSMMSDPLLRRYILEWRAPTTQNFTGFWLFVALLGSACLWARSPRRPALSDLLIYSAFAWLAIGAVRHILWFGIVLAPMLAVHLAALLSAGAPQRRVEPASPLLGRLVTLLLAVLGITLLPWMQPILYLGPGFAQGVALEGSYRGLLSDTTPVAAVEWLRQHPIEGRFFTDMSYASYTMWALPEKQVFADQRIELLPEHVWLDYFAIAEGQDTGAIRERWGITHMLLNRTWQKDLIAQLGANGAWQQVYGDRDSVIVMRRDVVVGAR